MNIKRIIFMKRQSVFLLLILISTSCEKQNEINKNQFTVLEAKDWFATYSSSSTDQNEKTGRIEINRSTSKIKKQLFWENVKIRRVFDKDILMVPIWYESNYRFGKQTLRQLWIYKNKAMRFEAKIVEFLATQEYKRTHTGISFQDFSGSITIHNWHNGFELGYQMENGKLVGRVIEYDFASEKKNTNNGRTDASCGYYQYTYVSVPALGLYFAPQVQWVSVNCYFQYSYSEPYDYYSWVEVNYGCAYFNNCQGYQDPYYYYYEPEPVVDYCSYGQCIQNQLTTPCLVNTANKVLNTSLNDTYNNLIQDVFGTSDKVNLILVEGNAKGGYGGTTRATTDGYGFINVTIVLDPSQFIDASQEFVASTIYHEAFHALTNYLSDNSYSQLDQHVALFTSYVDLLSQALQSAYPNLSFGDAKSLILKGALNIEDKLGTQLVDKIIGDFSRSQIRQVESRYETMASGTACN
jgi:hypothetical protein